MAQDLAGRGDRRKARRAHGKELDAAWWGCGLPEVQR